LKLKLGLLLIAALAVGPTAFGRTTATKGSTSKNAQKTKKSSHKRHARKTARGSWKSRGQKSIASDRTREIQQALIREKFLAGSASGLWDARTQEACRRYQAANGWQTKVLPDSRALIKLGLGPDHSDVLNPETAATSPYLPGGGEKSTSALAPGTSAVRQ
jgi:peptidoglycan hydrolase-like protein with peptidoglycan-binding domain